MSENSTDLPAIARSRRIVTLVVISCLSSAAALLLLCYAQVVEEPRTDITNLEIAFRTAGMNTVAAVLWLTSAVLLAVAWTVTVRRHQGRTACIIAAVFCLVPPASVLNQVYRWHRPSPEKIVDAARQGDVAEVQRQLDAGVSVNAVAMRRLAFGYGGSEGGTPLSAAIQHRQVETVRLLIRRGANVNRRDLAKAPPLQGAILYGGAEIVDLLLDSGAKLTDANWNAVTWAIHSASSSPTPEQGDAKAVFDVLDRHGADWEPPAIHESVMKDVFHLEFARHLARLRRARRPSEASPQTDLLNAIALGEDEVAVEILEADSMASREKEKLLGLAAKFGATGTAKLLIDSGARVDWPEHFGYVVDSPLNNALDYGHVDTAKLLIERGADVNAVYQRLITPLVHAAGSGRVELVRMLIDAGADVNQPQGGRTPLMVAAAKGKVDVVKLLIASGAETNVKAYGRTPISEANRNGHEATAQYLQSLLASET